MRKILLLSFLFSVATLSSFADGVADRYRLILELSKINVTIAAKSGHIGGLNLTLDQCSSFPYYGLGDTGVENIYSHFIQAIDTVQEKIDRDRLRFPKYVKEKLISLSDLILDQETKKTFHCRYGQTNSFIALATVSPNDDGIEKYDMAEYPSIIFDTNRMGGNFPMDVDPQKFRLFYGDKLDGVTIEAGSRNPLYAKTNNPTSLIFHEMMHWTGSKHFDKSYADIVYLSQFCFFSHDNISTTTSRKACEYLEDEKLWQNDQEARIEYIGKNKIREFIKTVKDLYHSHF